MAQYAILIYDTLEAGDYTPEQQAASRNEVERTIAALKNSRAVATRYDKRAYIFHGTVTLASIRLWLRP